MNLSKKIFISFTAIFLATLSTTSIAKAHPLKFYLQPYKGTKIYINDRAIKYKVIEKDKTIGLIQLKSKIKNIKKLTFKNKKRKLFTVSFSNDKTIKKYFPKKKRRLIYLNKKKSRLTYIDSFYTGREPKSVRFINKDEIVLPLLNDTGVDVINISKKTKYRLNPPTEYSKKEGFVESIFIPETNELWVTQMFMNCIHIFDMDKKKYRQTIDTTGVFNKVLLHDSNNDIVYVSHWLSNEISAIDVKKKIEIEKFSAGGAPRGMTFGSDHKKLFVAQFGKRNAGDTRGETVIINLKNKKIIKRFGIPGSKRHIIYSKKQNLLYISDMKHAIIDVYSLKKEKIIKKIKVFSKPNTIVLSKNEKYLIVSCRGPNHPVKGYRHKGLVTGRLEIIDLKNMKKIESIECGNQPTGLDINDQNIIALTDFLDERVRIFRFDE